MNSKYSIAPNVFLDHRHLLPVTALYVLRDLDVAKVGIVRTPYAELPTVLKHVQARVRDAVPGVRPLRVRDLPPVEVWVALSPVPRMLRELEAYLVERFGSPDYDPMGRGRREFIHPDHVPVARVLVDLWGSMFPSFISCYLHSSDAGSTYACLTASASRDLSPPPPPLAARRPLRALALEQVVWRHSASQGCNLVSDSMYLLPLLVEPQSRRLALSQDLVNCAQGGFEMNG